MELSEYLETNKIPYHAFGRLIGCDKSQVSRIANKLRRATLDQAIAIERATDGLVTPKDLVISHQAGEAEQPDIPDVPQQAAE